ncbi:MAG: class I SAM-dependent methyltransferase [Myxococcota bacterium]
MRFDRYDRIVEYYPTMWPLLVPGYTAILGAMRDIVRARDTAPTALLDVGCGTGNATIAVAPACAAGAKVSLLDGSQRMLATAQRTLGNQVDYAVGEDFTRSGVLEQTAPAEAFDLVLLSFALHHLEDEQKRATIDHLSRALRPGGMLLLADEVATDRPGGWDMVERVRGRMISEHLSSGRIPDPFWQLETQLPAEAVLPFRPSRVDDLTSWMARAGLGVACPVSVLGSALLVGMKPVE